MGSVLLVSLLTFLPLCLGVSPAWSLAGEEHGSKSHQGVLGSVVKEGGAYKYLKGSIKGTFGLELPGSTLTEDALKSRCHIHYLLSSTCSSYQSSLTCVKLAAGSVAQGRYVDAKQTPSYTGQLHLSTSGSFSDHDQMFAAGYLEGYISAGEHCLPRFCCHTLPLAGTAL